uniref:Putative secreted protein n=1 Tax=Ixodes ricinus TaxID=34613 RepID=A0A6B0UNL0_IXORI
MKRFRNLTSFLRATFAISVSASGFLYEVPTGDRALLSSVFRKLVHARLYLRDRQIQQLLLRMSWVVWSRLFRRVGHYNKTTCKNENRCGFSLSQSLGFYLFCFLATKGRLLRLWRHRTIKKK